STPRSCDDSKVKMAVPPAAWIRLFYRRRRQRSIPSMMTQTQRGGTGFRLCLGLLLAAGILAPAQTLENLALAYRKNPRPQTRAAVLRFPNAHPKDINGALALLVLGATEMEQRQFGDAQQHLEAAG